MPLFGDLSVGTSGLKASQYALNVVAHNLANVDTAGYVRQQTLLDTAVYQKIGQTAVSPMQVGLGVDPSCVRQVRDTFLDKTYRQEVGRQGYYESQRDAVIEIESLFGELDGVAFQKTLSDFWVSLQELSKEPDSRVAQATLVETAISFIDRAGNIARQLKEYQLNLNTMITAKVNRINEIGDQIQRLNKKIAFYESSGLEHANDYRDERNNLLDELGAMVKINYKELENGEVTVGIEGVQFVSEDYCMHMGYMSVAQYNNKHNVDTILDETADMLVPVWPHLGSADVFDWSKLPTSTANTDIGSLKGLILARGTAVGRYTTIPKEPKAEDFVDEVGNMDVDAYRLAHDQYELDVKEYNLHVESSIVMRTEAQFDQLIHGVVTTLNDIFCPDKEVTVAAGTTITLADGSEYTFEDETVIRIYDDENAPVGVDADYTDATELFSRKSFNRYAAPQDITLADGSVLEGARIYTWEHADDVYSMYTVSEVEVNPVLIDNKSKLPLISRDRTGDYDLGMIQRLMKAWQTPFATLSPNTLTYNNFDNYYTQLIGEIATSGDEFETLASNQECMVNSVQDERLDVTGVGSDEELTYLIRYQHAYNASARYINVVDEMLEHLLSKLG